MATRRQSLEGTLILAALVVVVLAATALHEASAQLCPLCECPATYQLVCGKTVDKDGKVRFRGFPSRCVMECSNQCRKAQFEFVKRGRCGPKIARPAVDPKINSALPKGNKDSANTTMSSIKGVVTVPVQ